MRYNGIWVCAAFALACGMLHTSAAWGVYQKDFLTQDDFSCGSSMGLKLTPTMDGICLSDCTSIVPFIWAPSPVDGAVSKIDSRYGLEIARYQTGPAAEQWAPECVASDSDGNTYVACAVPGQSAKIIAIPAKGGFDRNKDQYISTSGDYNKDMIIEPNEILAWGEDEKVALLGEAGAPDAIPTAMICDSEGNLWVALAGQCCVQKVDVKTGQVVASVNISGRPNALALGTDSILWALSAAQSQINAVDVRKCSLNYTVNLDFLPRGMVVDRSNTVWMGNADGGIVSLNSDRILTRHTGEGCKNTSAIALDKNGDILCACPATGIIARFNHKDGSFMESLKVERELDCIGTDADGYIWALIDRGASAIKYNPTTGEQEAVANTGNQPFSGSPFGSSYREKSFLPTGIWSTVVDSELDGAAWGALGWKSADNGCRINVQIRTNDNLEKLYCEPYRTVLNGERFNSKDGRYIQIKVTLEGNGYYSPELYAMRLEGRNRPPDISKAVASRPFIRRLDHVMEEVGIEGITDPEGDEVSVKVTAVMQDETNAALCEDDKGPDAILTGQDSVWLKGECDPGTKEDPGNGRVYTVYFRATDEYGAESSGSIKVQVPPTMSTLATAKEDKDHWDSTKDLFKNIAKAE